MTQSEKIEWAKRAFAKIAQDCLEMTTLDVVKQVPGEMRAWRSIAAKARRNIKILEQGN